MIDALKSWLFPTACLGCGTAGIALCGRCLPEPALHFALDDLPVWALGSYDGLLRRAVLAFKAGERAYASAFAALWRLRIVSSVSAAALPPLPRAVLVGAPTTRGRVAARGFDQAELLAASLAAFGDLGHARDVLTRRGCSQFGLRRDARLAAHGRFRAARPSRRPLASGLLIRGALLIDDVCTTGATLRDASAALKRANIPVRGALVLARTPPGRLAERGEQLFRLRRGP